MGTETTLGKVILCRGPNSDPRQNRRQVKAVCLPSQVYRRPCFAESRTSAKINFCQRPFFADGRTLGKGPGCREEFFADGLALGKYGFADGLPLPRADSRQTFLCREPDIWLSAKTLALGNGPVSGIEPSTLAWLPLSRQCMWHDSVVLVQFYKYFFWISIKILIKNIKKIQDYPIGDGCQT